MTDFDDELSLEIIQAVERELLIETNLEPADLLFVFGTRTGVPEFLQVIAELWRDRLFKWAIVSGGATGGILQSEARVIAEAMYCFGVPPERIFLEEQATNTGSNVEKSLPIIERELGLANIRSVIAVGKYYSSARYLMTLERHWPSVKKMLAPVHFHPHPREEWYQHPETRIKVLKEWNKLSVYLTKGYIVPWAPAKSK